LSESPTWGGGSWLSYTSTILGMRIDNHPQYLELRNRYQLGKYPSLGKSLQDQGYHFVWVSSLDENLSDLAWAKYTRFLGVDELIRNQQMEYIGPRYGWGPAPPDQWVLHWAHDRLQAATDKPLLFFTITQNSHYPWATHPDAGRGLAHAQPIGRRSGARRSRNARPGHAAQLLPECGGVPVANAHAIHPGCRRR
jgi:hypothetical protein